MALRIIQWGTGAVGKEVLATILDPRSGLELVGVKVYSDDKNGVDAGALIGREHVGVLATTDVERMLGLEADCVAGSQQHCVTAITPMKICCSYRCAVTHHQCTATLILAKCTPHCSVLLCKTGWQQPCVTAIAPMKIHCAYSCAMHPPPRLAAALCHCNYTYEDLLFIQVCKNPPPMHCNTDFGNALHTAQCCSAKQAHSSIV